MMLDIQIRFIQRLIDGQSTADPSNTNPRRFPCP
jgi:hypothetical protein